MEWVTKHNSVSSLFFKDWSEKIVKRKETQGEAQVWITNNKNHPAIIKKNNGNNLPNRERIRTLGEKKNYKNLAILEATIIRQMKMKEK